jgi:hypothetical protein
MEMEAQLAAARDEANSQSLKALQLQCILDAKIREINILRMELSSQVRARRGAARRGIFRHPSLTAPPSPAPRRAAYGRSCFAPPAAAAGGGAAQPRAARVVMPAPAPPRRAQDVHSEVGRLVQENEELRTHLSNASARGAELSRRVLELEQVRAAANHPAATPHALRPIPTALQPLPPTRRAPARAPRSSAPAPLCRRRTRPPPAGSTRRRTSSSSITTTWRRATSWSCCTA